MTFGHEGERTLSDWMAANARVVWAVAPSPWEVEQRLIQRLILPLNLDQNSHSSFHSALSAARSRQREIARQQRFGSQCDSSSPEAAERQGEGAVARDYYTETTALAARLAEAGHGSWSQRLTDMIAAGATATEILMGLR